MTETVAIGGAGAADALPTVVPLRRNWRFQLLWIGSTTALTGVSAADVAYPLAILGFTGSPALSGLFGFLQVTATVVCGLPAGQVVDRYDRRGVLIGAETVRAATVATIAALFALNRLTLFPLLFAALLLGAAQPFGGAARMLVVRSVVAPEQLTAALTQDQARISVATLAGPPLGGLLYGLSRALPFLFSALSLLLSVACALVARPGVAPARAARRSDRPNDNGSNGDRGSNGILAGVRALWADPTLRAALVLVTALNACGAPLELAAIYLLHRQSTPAWGIGLALSGAAAGGLAGAALVKPLYRRFRPGTLLIGITAAVVPLVITLGLVSGPLPMAAILFCAMLGIPALSVLLDVLIFRQVPEALRGRSIAATMTIISLGIPLGTGGVGLLLQYLGGTGTMLTLAGILAGSIAWAATQHGLRAAQWPVT